MIGEPAAARRVGPSARATRRRPRPTMRRAAARCSSVSRIAPPLPAVGVLDRVVARLGDREHGVGALRRRSTPRRSSHVPTRRRTLRIDARVGGTSIAMRRRHVGHADEQQRHVVVGRRGGEHAVQHGVARRRGGARRVSRSSAGQQVDAVVDAGAAALDEAVGVGEQRRAGGELQALLADRLALGPAERRRRGPVERRDRRRSPRRAAASAGGRPRRRRARRCTGRT